MSLLDAFQELFMPRGLLLVSLGTILGIAVGAIPGLTGAMLIALTLPLTFHMQGGDALVLLVSMYVGSVSGGLITATLLRMPGTPASIMTTLDGYPLAQRGQAGRALGLGIVASFGGGVISWAFLVALSRPMAQFSSRLGHFEFFALVVMAMVLIASVAGRSLLRGVFAGLLGMLATMPGTSPAGELRFTGGFTQLDAGLKLLPVLIGLFAVNQVLQEILRGAPPPPAISMSQRELWSALNGMRRHVGNVLRSSVIGTWIGILPGIGANIGSVVAYGAARNFSKTPSQFGQGCEEGIVASESANNATVGGALIPLVALGVPGSVIDAILLGALVIHGLQPGPLLFANNPREVHLMMVTVLVANLVMLIFMLAATRYIARLMYVPRYLLLPAVLACCVVGSYALGNRGFDVAVMLAFGVIGLLLEKLEFPLAPFVIGLVLAPVAESNLTSGLMLSGGSWLPLVTRPMCVLLLAVAGLLLAWPLWRRWRGREPAHPEVR